MLEVFLHPVVFFISPNHWGLWIPLRVGKTQSLHQVSDAVRGPGLQGLGLKTYSDSQAGLKVHADCSHRVCGIGKTTQTGDGHIYPSCTLLRRLEPEVTLNL